MALEQYKTQVLLLHSEQSTLDSLSTGFNERYSVHMATSGIEALNVFTETPVHVIVSAQDLPGMSGLDALREAKKRSPTTIGILLAGDDPEEGLEALVSDKEVFQIVHGDVTPDGLRTLIDSATQRARILAMSESANDSAANVDHPSTEHIVMETSENGSTIISDGTGQMPALQPNKISVSPDSGSRNVDILVLTKDDEFLATIKDSARGLHNVHHAVTPSQSEEIIKGHKVGILVTDAAMVGSNIEVLTQRLRQNVPRLVAVVAGRRDDGELLMDLINRGHVYRFLLKPVSPGRARLAIEASIKHHLDADDKAFKSAPKKAQAEPKPKPNAKAAPDTRPKVAKPAPINVSRDDSLLDEGLDAAFDEGNSFTETMTGIAVTFGKKITAVAETITSRSKPEPEEARLTPKISKPEPVEATQTPKVSKPKPEAAPPAPVESKRPAPIETNPPVDTMPPLLSLSESTSGLMQNPKMLGMAAAAVIVISGIAWFALSSDDAPPVEVNVDAAAPTSVVESNVPPAPTPAFEGTETTDFLAAARNARDTGQLISPPGENAVELYVSALQDAPNDTVVASELDAVIEQVFAIAESAILRQELADASTALQLLYFASPDNTRLPFLSAQLTQLQVRSTLEEARIAIAESRFEDAANYIANARILAGPDATEVSALADALETAQAKQQSGEVIAKANARLDQDQLIAPPNDNARYYFQLALANDPANTAARQGMTIIASKLALQARVAIDDGQLTNAEDLIRNARALDPSSAELAASVIALDNAKAAKAQSALDAQAEVERQAEQQRIAEEQRVAEQQRIADEQREAEEQRIAAAAVVAAAAVSSSSGNTDTGSRNAETPGTNSEQTADVSRGTDAPTQDSNTVDSNPQDSGVASGATAAVALNTSSATTPEVAQPIQVSTTADADAGDTSASRSTRIEMVPVSSLTRVNYVAPKYPRSARRRNVTGAVEVSFRVLGNGTVSDVVVANSTPGTTFDKAALDAVAQWRFEPVIENGESVEKVTAVRLSFDLQ